MILKKKIIILPYLLLGLSAYFLNFWTANKGVFPIDTFLHYDSAFKILNNEIPIKDFWIIHGLTLDYIQSIFFYFFGSNWFSYVAHSSTINCIITLTVFHFLDSVTKKNLYSISRTFDKVTIPFKEGKYQKIFKDFFYKKIYENNIEILLFVSPNSNYLEGINIFLTSFLPNKCYNILDLSNEYKIVELDNCKIIK